MDMEKIATLVLWMVPFIFSLSVHEFAHAWTAKKFGDNTAESMGRVSLNPMAHIDPIGTLFFPIVGFLSNFPVIGWAKPVPVNGRNLKNPVKDGMWVAAAGPISNLILALIFTCILAVYFRTTNTSQFPSLTLSPGSGSTSPLISMLFFGVYLNVLLAFFNMLPMPPLDGGHVLRGLFPSLAPQLDMIEKYGFLILIVLLYTGALRILLAPAMWIIGLLLNLAGIA